MHISEITLRAFSTFQFKVTYNKSEEERETTYLFSFIYIFHNVKLCTLLLFARLLGCKLHFVVSVLQLNPNSTEPWQEAAQNPPPVQEFS